MLGKKAAPILNLINLKQIEVFLLIFIYRLSFWYIKKGAENSFLAVFFIFLEVNRMSLIHVLNLTFGYDGSYDTIFENINFQIDTDWKLGFIGRNGRGKTTFLKLLQGMYEYKGTITTSVDFDYFPFEIKNKTQNTVDIIDTICCDYELWRLNKELSLLDISQDTLFRSFETLSNGEQTKILLAALFLKENHFLLIDEPTNHLDFNARKIVSDYLNTKKGFLLVSHDREFLDGCIDHVLSINKANIEIQKGNFSSWQKNKEQNDNYEISENQKLKKEINRLSETAKKTANWSDKVEKTKYATKNSGSKPDRGYIGHKAAKMMQRSKNLETRQNKALEEKTKLLKNIDTIDCLSIKSLNYHKNTLIEFMNVSLYYNQKNIWEKLNFSVSQGERIALTGKNGSGKTSILKLILNEPISYTGTVSIASGLVFSYVSQDTSFLKGNLSDFAKQNQIEESLFKAILRKLDFSRIQFEKDMSDFSQGQKKKVLIARSLCQKAHLYIWDEPLNYVDILSRIQIENLIKQYQPTMIFVEHDQAFIHSIATKIIFL